MIDPDIDFIDTKSLAKLASENKLQSETCFPFSLHLLKVSRNAASDSGE
jgi:hypothetical protein